MPIDQTMYPEYHFLSLDKLDSIRLVKIEPQRLDDTPLICCTIQHFPDKSQEIPSYDALSYVWGDTNVKETILIRVPGHAEGIESKFWKLDVHINLWRFLDQISKSKDTPPWLWTDFLCINQDSLQEKDEQISRMGEIYSNARQTIAWLGRSDSSPSQIQAEESVEHHMLEIPRALRRPPFQWESFQKAFESSQRSWMDFVRKVRSADQAIWVKEVWDASDMMEEVRSQIPKAVMSRFNPWISAPVDKILSLDYWKRVWIVQEVALANKVELRYGDTTLDFDDFIRAYQVRFFYPGTRSSLACRNEAIAAVEARIAGDDISIREIIEWSQRCECSIPVDRVKGLFALLRKQKLDRNTEKALHTYLDAAFATPLQKSGLIVRLHVDLADYEAIVDQFGIALLGQPSPSLDLKILQSYSNDSRNNMGLLMMARAAKRIAISCAAIGFGSARVSKDSFDWRPETGLEQHYFFDCQDGNSTMPLQILIASLSLRPVPVKKRVEVSPKALNDGHDDRAVKAAVMGIRLANRVMRDSEWSCVPAADRKCLCNKGHEQLDISCELTLIEGADHPISGRPLCASRIQDNGHNCQGSNLFLDVKDIEHDDWRLSLTLKDGTSLEKVASLDISLQYCLSEEYTY